MLRPPRVLASLFLALALVCGGVEFSPIPSAIVHAQKKTVKVKGYTKKDGTKVAAHERKAPSKKKASEKAKKKPAASPPAPAKPKSEQARDSHGRFIRSNTVRHQFMRQTGYPQGRPGYIIDHIIPLACGGPDVAMNMQWQTVEAAKAKDRTERIGCVQ